MAKIESQHLAVSSPEFRIEKAKLLVVLDEVK
jgi:hypothetical protein